MKKGALELSIGTIVIIVLAMSMLILGLVLVRSIMCGAIGLTGDINNKVKNEISNLFQTTASEVVCVGSGSEPVPLIPGKANTVYCGVKADRVASYEIRVINLPTYAESWIQQGTKGFGPTQIAPSDDLPKKIMVLNIPKEASQAPMRINVQVYKDNNLISTQSLDFEITRVGWFKGAVC